METYAWTFQVHLFKTNFKIPVDAEHLTIFKFSKVHLAMENVWFTQHVLIYSIHFHLRQFHSRIISLFSLNWSLYPAHVSLNGWNRRKYMNSRQQQRPKKCIFSTCFEMWHYMNKVTLFCLCFHWISFHWFEETENSNVTHLWAPIWKYNAKVIIFS